MAVVIGFGPMENGNHALKDHVFVSPNMCEEKRTTLRGMAETFSNDFKRTMTAYREAARADVARQIQVNKQLMADKAALQAENERLRARVEAAEAAGTIPALETEATFSTSSSPSTAAGSST